VEDETFKHLFLTCRHTKKLHGDFCNKYLVGAAPQNAEEETSLWFTGAKGDEQKINKYSAICILLFQSKIWEYKLKKKVPGFTTLMVDYMHDYDIIFSMSSEFRKKCPRSKINLMRRNNGDADDRGGRVPPE
jgi:hypothetical protein